jgi:hypothetical protein
MKISVEVVILPALVFAAQTIRCFVFAARLPADRKKAGWDFADEGLPVPATYSGKAEAAGGIGAKAQKRSGRVSLARVRKFRRGRVVRAVRTPGADCGIESEL